MFGQKCNLKIEMQNQQLATPLNFIAPAHLFSVVQKLQDPLQKTNVEQRKNNILSADPEKFQGFLNSSFVK